MKKTEGNLPIACTLDSASLHERKGLLWELLGRASERRELDNGFEFEFAAEAVNLNELVQMVELERNCCRFLRLVLTVEPARGPMRIELSGKDEASKQFLLSLLPPR